MKNVFLFYGEDQKALKSEVKHWKDSFLDKHPDSPNLSVARDKLNLAQLTTEMMTAPFLGEKRLIVVFNAYTDYKEDDKYDTFIKYLSNLPETTIVVLAEEGKLAKNAKIIKEIGKIGTVKHFEKSRSSLQKDFKEIIAKHEKEIDPMILNELIINLNEDPYKVRAEAEKLSLYSEESVISQKDIDSVVRFDSQISVFKLMDSVTAKKIREAMDQLQQMNENGEDLVKLFYLLARQIRILISVKYAFDQQLSPKEIGKMTGLQPFIVNKTIGQVKEFSYEKLLKLLEYLLELDVKIKRGHLKYSKSNRNELLFELEKFLIDCGRK